MKRQSLLGRFNEKLEKSIEESDRKRYECESVGYRYMPEGNVELKVLALLGSCVILPVVFAGIAAVTDRSGDSQKHPTIDNKVELVVEINRRDFGLRKINEIKVNGRRGYEIITGSGDILRYVVEKDTLKQIEYER